MSIFAKIAIKSSLVKHNAFLILNIRTEYAEIDSLLHKMILKVKFITNEGTEFDHLRPLLTNLVNQRMAITNTFNRIINKYTSLNLHRMTNDDLKSLASELQNQIRVSVREKDDLRYIYVNRIQPHFEYLSMSFK